MSADKPTRRRSLSGKLVPLERRPFWHDIVRAPEKVERARRMTEHDRAMSALPPSASLRVHVLNDAEPTRHYDESTAPGRPVEFHGPNRERLRASGKRGKHAKSSMASRRKSAPSFERAS